MFYTLSFCVLRLGQPVFVLFALFLLCFNIIIPCGIISLLPPYKTFGNEAFPLVTHVKFPLLSPLPNIGIDYYCLIPAHDLGKTSLLRSRY